MKLIILSILLITIDCCGQSYFHMKAIRDTVFYKADTTQMVIGVDSYKGTILPIEVTRIDSIFKIKSNQLVLFMGDDKIYKTHYYTKEGSKIICNQYVWIISKIWLTAE